jgi:hypothetical protein
MVYGTLSAFMHRGLSLVEWAIAYTVFVLLLLAVTMVKNYLVAEIAGRKPRLTIPLRGPIY